MYHLLFLSQHGVEDEQQFETLAEAVKSAACWVNDCLEDPDSSALSGISIRIEYRKTMASFQF